MAVGQGRDMVPPTQPDLAVTHQALCLLSCDPLEDSPDLVARPCSPASQGLAEHGADRGQDRVAALPVWVLSLLMWDVGVPAPEPG